MPAYLKQTFVSSLIFSLIRAQFWWVWSYSVTEISWLQIPKGMLSMINSFLTTSFLPAAEGRSLSPFCCLHSQNTSTMFKPSEQGVQFLCLCHQLTLMLGEQLFLAALESRGDSFFFTNVMRLTKNHLAFIGLI